jgi:hypothetical protein
MNYDEQIFPDQLEALRIFLREKLAEAKAGLYGMNITRIPHADC